MKLYTKQKVFSWKDRFTVTDADQNVLYTAESEFLSLGKKLHLHDAAGREAAFIHQKLLSFLPRYYISQNGSDVAEVVKKFTVFRQEYIINGLGWSVSGNFWAHEYTICAGARAVASISKKWLSWGDTYEIDIVDPSDTVMALCVVLIIDAVMYDEAAAASSSAT